MMSSLRKKIFSVFLCKGCLLAFTACKTNTANKESSSPATQSDTVNDVESKKISTIMGDVSVPTNPQRVVVQYLMGDLGALGIQPVGVSEAYEGSAFEENVSTAESLGLWEFNLESLMALDPDLIIAVNEDQYEDFSKIAPTIIVPYGSMTTEERLTFLGDVVNKQEEAKKAWLDYSQKVETAKGKLSEHNLQSATATILQVYDNGISVSGSKHALGILVYQELGLLPPEAVQKDIIDKDEYWAQPSMEILEKYCGDYMIHLGPISEKVTQNAVWNSIPAVKNNKVIECDTALTYYTDVMSSSALVDFITNQILSLSEQ